MVTIPASAIAAAETTLTDTCTISRTTTEASFTQAGGLVDGTATTVYAGPCSLGPPKTDRRSLSGGDERMIDARVLRIPTSADPVRVGDHVSATGHGSFVVDRVQTRTTEVLRRVRVVAAADAAEVPR